MAFPGRVDFSPPRFGRAKVRPTFVRHSVSCLLTSQEIQKMEQSVNKIIKPRLDRVRYYSICQQCLKEVEVTSGPERLTEIEVIVV